MSTTWSRLINYYCYHDHGLGESCKGHTLRIGLHRTSDTVTIEVDNSPLVVFDDGQWEAIQKAIFDLRRGKEELRVW